METNKTVNYTPDDPTNCKPTSHVVCTYCRSARNCPSKIPYERYKSVETLESETKSTNNNLFQ